MRLILLVVLGSIVLSGCSRINPTPPDPMAMQSKSPDPWDYSPDLVRRAEAGDPEAQLWLGDRYSDGKGVSRDDKLALEWWRKSAEQGNPDAKYNLGWRYWDGRGGAPFDRGEAVRYWKSAAERKHIWSMAALGHAYLLGDGVQQDYKLAVSNFQIAKDRGSNWAQLLLGRCYENGWGVPRDRQEAIRLYRRASVAGTPQEQELAKGYLREIEAESAR